MGSVFRASDSRRQDDVAVKLLAPGLEGDPALRSRLEREGRALSMLRHTGIVQVYEVGEADGQFYLAMECIEGQSLAERIPLEPAEVVRVAISLCDALHYAHGQGIVHRDVKPANVLVDHTGRVVLTDFGIARLSDNSSGAGGSEWTLTATGHVAGTPVYTAPEALRGERPDPRMDVYSVGVLIYELLQGEPPVGAFAPLEGRLDGIVRRAMASDPALRFADMASLRAALANDAAAAVSPSAPLEPPPDETAFMRVAAIVQTIASAVALWALYLCTIPQRIAPADVRPLLMVVPPQTPDRHGRLISLARFEIGPVLAAVAALGVGAAGYGLLRRHWRLQGLEVSAPHVPVESARPVLQLGVAATLIYAVHFSYRDGWFNAFVPILGGLMETTVVYLTWFTLLELSRRRRPWRLEWRLWVGLVLALVPPVGEYFRYLFQWLPR